MSTWRVADNTALPGGWRLLRVEHSALERNPEPGMWLETELPGRGVVTVPLMDASHRESWVAGLLPCDPDDAVTRLQRGEELEAQLCGEAIDRQRNESPAVIMGQGLGIGPALFLARLGVPGRHPLVFLETDSAFPFRHRPSQYMIPGLPPHAIATAPMLEAAGIPGRLAHPAGLPGCFEDYQP